MKRSSGPLLFCSVILLAIFVTKTRTDEKTYDANPPFRVEKLIPAKTDKPVSDQAIIFYHPKNPYNIFINYELGMHCVGFDISYCCIIPPYNSIQAQAVQSSLRGEKPRLLSPEDNVKLHYHLRDNSYSEGNKMKYWQVLKDVGGNGTMNTPNDNMANYVWDHLFIYKDLEGTIPENPQPSKRLRIGKEIPVNVDSGPSGKPLSLRPTRTRSRTTVEILDFRIPT